MFWGKFLFESKMFLAFIFSNCYGTIVFVIENLRMSDNIRFNAITDIVI